MKFFRSSLTVVSLCSALMLTACGSSTGGSTEQAKTIRVTNTSCSCFLPTMVAVEEGFLKEEMQKAGADVEIQNYEDGPSQTAALLSRSLDVAQYGTTAVASLLDRKAPVKAFYVSDKVLQTEGLVVRAEAGISRVADLKGKTVAVPQGTTSDYGLRGSLANAGLTISDIKVLNLAPPAMKSAWDRGDIDAAYIWSPFLNQLEDSSGQILESIGDLGKATGDEYQIMNLYVVRSDFAEQNPELLKAYTRAIDRGVAYIKDNPQQVAEILYQDLGVNSPQEAMALIEGEKFFASNEQRALLGDGDAAGNIEPLIKDVWQFGVDAKSLSSSPSDEAISSMLVSDYAKGN